MTALQFEEANRILTQISRWEEFAKFLHEDKRSFRDERESEIARAGYAAAVATTRPLIDAEIAKLRVQFEAI